MYLRNTTEARKTEQALRRSEQLAAAGRLAASIAHEINNPLEAAEPTYFFLAKSDQGLLQRVRRTCLRSRTRNCSGALAHHGAKPEILSPAHRARVDGFGRSHRLGRLLPRSIDQAFNTRVERRYRPAPPVLCLPGEIQQVFTNLVSNALDALAAKGRLILSVHPAKDRAGCDGVRVTIADSGSGMDNYMFDRLFHPFVTTKGETGTGLGLWVSKGILDKHHADHRAQQA